MLVSLKYLLKSLALGIPAGVTLIDVLGYVAKVEGSSMQPLLNPDSSPKSLQDYVFLYNWPIVNNKYEGIQRGEIIALISPRDPRQRLIKRVIAVPGDIIETSEVSRYNYSHNQSQSGGGTEGEKKLVRIPKGHIWVEGDHRGRSYDSTVFGPVALGLVKSKASAVVWPPRRWQVLEPTILPDRVPLNLQKERKDEELKGEGKWNLQ